MIRKRLREFTLLIGLHMPPWLVFALILSFVGATTGAAVFLRRRSVISPETYLQLNSAPKETSDLKALDHERKS
jgi:hypothetical protein